MRNEFQEGPPLFAEDAAGAVVERLGDERPGDSASIENYGIDGPRGSADQLRGEGRLAAGGRELCGVLPLRDHPS